MEAFTPEYLPIFRARHPSAHGINVRLESWSTIVGELRKAKQQVRVIQVQRELR